MILGIRHGIRLFMIRRTDVGQLGEAGAVHCTQGAPVHNSEGVGTEVFQLQVPPGHVVGVWCHTADDVVGVDREDHGPHGGNWSGL